MQIDAPIDAPSTAWRYRADHDDMRNEDTRIAQIESANTRNVRGRDAHLMMTLIQSANDKVPDIGFEIEHGRLECESLICIHARFDGQKVSPWPGKAARGAVLMAGTDKAKADWLKALRSSETVIVELSLADGGSEQFTFNSAGLIWPPK